MFNKWKNELVAQVHNRVLHISCFSSFSLFLRWVSWNLHRHQEPIVSSIFPKVLFCATHLTLKHILLYNFPHPLSLMSAYHILGMLWVLYMNYRIQSSQQFCTICIIKPILQMRELRRRIIKGLAQGHKLLTSRAWNLNPQSPSRVSTNISSQSGAAAFTEASCA